MYDQASNVSNKAWKYHSMNIYEREWLQYVLCYEQRLM